MSINGVHASEVDVLVVGAGFSGCYLLRLLRKRGLGVRLFEAGSGLGGTWYWNRYPGARVDVELPWYGYLDSAMWGDWVWKSRYPDHTELRGYFEHVDKVWGLSKDIAFNTKVIEARWEGVQWSIKTANGQVCKAKWFLPCIGPAVTPYIPNWKGIDSFKGEMHHSSRWPEGLDLTGKRVAVIGSGATGVQIMQEAGKVASHVTHTVRTPNIAVPMRQRSISEDEMYQQRAVIEPLFKFARTTFGALPFDMGSKGTFDDSPEAREALWQDRWRRGGFHWAYGSYSDMFFNREANRAMYDFWARKTRARVTDPKKREMLASVEPPHWIAGKRMSLERDYYEQCDKSHVEISNSPVVEVKENGILFEDWFREFDVIALATGFDALTGGLTRIGMKDKNGIDLGDKWNNGVASFLGMTVHGFPNMAYTYGPQAPTSFTNGPPFIEMQCEWITDMITKQAEEGLATVEPKRSEEQAWRKLCLDMGKMVLATETDSWYMGANIPGKKRELLLFFGGVPAWHEACKQALDGWKGFEVTKV